MVHDAQRTVATLRCSEAAQWCSAVHSLSCRRRCCRAGTPCASAEDNSDALCALVAMPGWRLSRATIAAAELRRRWWRLHNSCGAPHAHQQHGLQQPQIWPGGLPSSVAELGFSPRFPNSVRSNQCSARQHRATAGCAAAAGPSHPSPLLQRRRSDPSPRPSNANSSSCATGFPSRMSCQTCSADCATGRPWCSRPTRAPGRPPSSRWRCLWMRRRGCPPPAGSWCLPELSHGRIDRIPHSTRGAKHLWLRANITRCRNSDDGTAVACRRRSS